jgi:long-chain acyl-CoA synthetase
MVQLKGVVDASEMSMYEVLRLSRDFRPEGAAYSYLGVGANYAEFLEQVDRVSLCYRGLGISEGDRVVICLPNCPQALISFYALNRLGAVSVMVHPLSSASEIAGFIEDCGAKAAITIGMFVGNFPQITEGSTLRTLIVTSPVDPLPAAKAAIAKMLKKEAKVPRIEKGSGMIYWKDFLKAGASQPDGAFPEVLPDDPASILYTGGTTGINKGAVHTNRAFNTSAMAMTIASGLKESDGTRMLANLPMFHGFGLVTCFHIPVLMAVECVLMPTFSVEQICDVIRKERINYIAGVPNLFGKIIENGSMQNADLSSIAGVFCGGDSIASADKRRFDEFLKAHGSKTFMRVGYGSTEVLAAVSLTDRYEELTGSCGLPLPGFSLKVVREGTTEELPRGEYGEICIAGPSVMQGYLNNEEETAAVLKRHDDGKVWFHTGDAGYMDDEGHLYFVNRIKRIIVTSGYNVYPSQIEGIINEDERVMSSCVIGVPDKQRGEKVVAFIVPKEDIPSTDELLRTISERVENNIVSYARPRDYRIIDKMPRTKLYKIDFRQLEKDYLGTGSERCAGIEPRDGERQGSVALWRKPGFPRIHLHEMIKMCEPHQHPDGRGSRGTEGRGKHAPEDPGRLQGHSDPWGHHNPCRPPPERHGREGRRYFRDRAVPVLRPDNVHGHLGILLQARVELPP